MVINFLTDLGGLDNSATGQVLSSVGYNWTPSITATLGYRVLHTYERDESGPLRDFRAISHGCTDLSPASNTTS